MHTKAKKIALSGLMLAMTVVFISLGSVIEMNTLFLLAAASYFVGIVIREFKIQTGAAFYLAGVLLGFIVAPNKLYVIFYAMMGMYILLTEIAWERLGKADAAKPRKIILWIVKYVIFNFMFLTAVFGFGEIIFARKMSMKILALIVLAGQVGIYLFDRAYCYVQFNIWNKLRGKLLY